MRFLVILLAAALVSFPALSKVPPTDTKPSTEAGTTEPPPAAQPDSQPTPPTVDTTKPAAAPQDDGAVDDEALDDDWDGGGDDWGEDEPEPTFPRLEHHGYFRFRADMFSNLHLGTNFREANNITQGTSGFKPPLTENAVNNVGAQYPQDVVGQDVDETFLAGANMRFRYQPTFLISPSFKFSATFDVMDNVVLGSTPDFSVYRPDVPFAAFSGSQAPPGQGFQFKDSIRVKELYGEWKMLGIPLRFGRMSSDWGLGMLANDGNGWDDDFGDYQDRIMLAIKLYGVYVFGGYDIVSSGPTYKQVDQPFGQAYDLTETDDVQQGFFGVFSRPLQDEERLQRLELLVKQRKPAFDWGFYSVFRTQKLDLDQSSIESVADGTAQYDNIGLIKRDAWAVIPDIWLRFEYRPSYTTSVRLELEAAMIIGSIGKVTDSVDEPTRDLLSWGLAFEGAFTTGGLTVGLDAGAASGDDAKYLTVQDQKNFEINGKKNLRITNFKFDRDYHVDMIMFREVIGTITNSTYFKPYVRYDLFDSPDGAIGGRLDILTAFALEKNAYPGESNYLGTEFDAKLFIEDTNKFYADLAFGLYIPGAAFDLEPGFATTAGAPYSGDARSAEVAWTLQTHIVLKY